MAQKGANGVVGKGFMAGGMGKNKGVRIAARRDVFFRRAKPRITQIAQIDDCMGAPDWGPGDLGTWGQGRRIHWFIFHRGIFFMRK